MTYNISHDSLSLPMIIESDGSGNFTTSGNINDLFPDLKTDYANIPVLPLRRMVVFPNHSYPISVGRESSLKLVEYAEKHHTAIFLTMQRNPDIENPVFDDLYHVGVEGRVMKVIELPDGSTTALIVTGHKMRLQKIVKKKPFLRGIVEACADTEPTPDDTEMAAIFFNIEEIFQDILEKFDNDSTNEVKFALRQIKNPLERTNFIISHAPLDDETKQRLLEIDGMKARGLELIKVLTDSLHILEVRADIINKTQSEMSQQQREQYLYQQMRQIQDELGGSEEDKDAERFREMASHKKWPQHAEKHFQKELAKLERLNVNNPEYSVQYNYLETYLALPWEEYSDPQFKFSQVAKVLDRDHFGLKEVKERILESVAVMKMRSDFHAPILCLYGPPGVGKTSLGKSIAEALGREYARVSLGGMHDEAEIRGHRRTYIGAMPGRIMKALTKCSKSNPVFVLDEIDKIGADFKGDPSTALLEVLDPEQNCKFHDNFVEADYDLSKVFFIATANNLSGISQPLLDRMELIEITGYTQEEKVDIGKRHLLPKQLRELGLEKGSVKFEKKAMEYIVEHYTRESGVRQLDKKIAKVLRKIALEQAMGGVLLRKVTVDDVKRLLGKEEVTREMYENNDSIGVVTGLAWTQVGGEILFVESSLAPGKGEQLTLTGNLGDVMKESATLARQYLKAHAEEIGIDPEKFAKYDIHIHVPEGAIPKDGPSAGVTMVTSLASSFTGRKVKPRLAMTGEITLRGKVLPVGGIKEKILAAKRAGIETVVLCSQNRKDIEEITPGYLTGLQFIYVDRISEVLHAALEK